LFQHSLADDALAEEWKDSPIPATLLSISDLMNNLQEAKHPDTYTKAVATLAYAAQMAKQTPEPDKQRWTDLFIDSFRLIYSEMGDPNKALGLC